jgi:hypothetical protein
LETIVSHDIIGRLMLQCARQTGLSFVFEDLMGFEGAEFYEGHWPVLAGKTFRDALLSFPEAVPIGIVDGVRLRGALLARRGAAAAGRALRAGPAAAPRARSALLRRAAAVAIVAAGRG